MFKFLKASGGYIFAFLLAFLLIGNVATAQEDPAFFDDYAPADLDMDYDWDAQTWDFEDEFSDWDYTYDTTTTSDLTTEDAAVLAAIMGVWGIIMLIVFAPIYIYFALTLMTTAKKLNVNNAWFAWIPILNIVLMLQCAGLSPWLFLLMFVPFANIIIMIFAYMKIAERRGFESWLGILMIVPVANIIIPGYLAWGEPPKKGE